MRLIQPPRLILMMSFNPTIQDLFGRNASLTDSQLTINKSDLSNTGLDQYPSNIKALYVAIVINTLWTYQGVLVDQAGNLISPNEKELIGYDYDRISPEFSLSLEAKYIENNKRVIDIHVRHYTRL